MYQWITQQLQAMFLVALRPEHALMIPSCDATLQHNIHIMLCQRLGCGLQALFNYFSCSAVAIANLVGGSNSAMVTALMIAAHMVSTEALHCPIA